MKVAGGDHDMLLLAHVLNLYGRPVESFAAYQTGMDDEACQNPAGLETVSNILTYSGLQVWAMEDLNDRMRDWATLLARAGHAVLVQMNCPDLDAMPIWHLVADAHPPYFATVCLVDQPKEPYMGGDVSQALTGAMVVVMQRCPRYEGSWEELFPE